ncbi:GAF domain-containing protein [Leptolyngbya sp. NIES-2104]|uniref:GAF domain-containing protein n=1 Tax=Leptolyngbya sp. NIES-2104 TaxID=1552121 RepID=UPI0006ECC700|nr:GAF domain-containing protein [Leptolyngbya sp. NIES-2104]GAP94944.1 circadian input kinase A [Leptolyngbya sp. NIES-2104]
MKEFSSKTDRDSAISLTPSAPHSIQFTLDRFGTIINTNDRCLIQLGYSSQDLIGRSISSLFHIRDRSRLHSALSEGFQHSNLRSSLIFSLIRENRQSIDVIAEIDTFEDSHHVTFIVLTCKLLNSQNHFEQTPEQTALEALQYQQNREQLISAIALRIRESLDLNTILYRTVEEVRLFLDTDRVLIYRFEPDWSGTIAVESVNSPWEAILGRNFQDPCFTETHIRQYQNGRIQVVGDIHAANLQPCHQELLASLQVRANLVVPIVSEMQLWGLLIAQHCQGARHWQSSTVDLLKQLATQVGIAVQQAELLNRVQDINAQLELQVEERTRKLQQILNFEKLARRITEKVRDTLDENQILQSVTQELTQVLKLDRALVERYDDPSFVAPNDTSTAHLACSIVDDQGILGDLWLIRDRMFEQDEIDFVQQIANQCAIAIRQARLYQTVQTKAEGLETLIRLKDEFLTSITHELRTPISSISLATQTLQKVLELKGALTSDNPTVIRTIEILERECQREIRSIDNLLTLSYLDAGEMINPIKIDLNVWLPRAAAPFRDRASTRQQQFKIDIHKQLPLLKTDLTYLERILVELLNNAYKYTPANGDIVVRAIAINNQLQLCVSNSSAEMTPEQLQRIFEKFYRIPDRDIWEASGAGLGLAVVKKLTERLGATIAVESSRDRTAFTLTFDQSR